MHQRVAAIVSVEISQNVPLRIQEKSVNAVSGGQVADVISDHAVKPAHPIAAGKSDFDP